MSVIVHLYAGPGAGKSTAAASLFASLKKHHREHSVELVREYVKERVWRGDKVGEFDQSLFYGVQLSREASLYGKVDVIVSDAPPRLGPVYESIYGDRRRAAVIDALALVDRRAAEQLGHVFVDVRVMRAKPYDPRGRLGGEDGARQVDARVAAFGRDFALTPDNEHELLRLVVDKATEQKAGN